jgi:hypothetical protein
MAVPNKLIAVDIFSSRLCVFILNSSWASSITKALETPSFRKSAELKRHFYQMSYDGHQREWEPGAKARSWDGLETLRSQVLATLNPPGGSQTIRPVMMLHPGSQSLPAATTAPRARGGV